MRGYVRLRYQRTQVRSSTHAHYAPLSFMHARLHARSNIYLDFRQLHTRTHVRTRTYTPCAQLLFSSLIHPMSIQPNTQ